MNSCNFHLKLPTGNWGKRSKKHGKKILRAPKCTATSYQESITKANLRFLQWFQTVKIYFDSLTLSWRHIWSSEMLRTTYPITQHIPKDPIFKINIPFVFSFHINWTLKRLTHFPLFPDFPSLFCKDIIPCSYAIFLYHQSTFAQDAPNPKEEHYLWNY